MALEIAPVTEWPYVGNIVGSAINDRNKMILSPDGLITTIRAKRNLVPKTIAFRASRRRTEENLPLGSCVLTTVFLETFISYPCAYVAAIHAAIPHIESGASTLGTGFHEGTSITAFALIHNMRVK